MWNYITILLADSFLYNLLREKKIPKQQILILLVSNLFVGNKLRPQSTS